MRSALIVLAASASFLVTAANFHFESNSLTDDEISSFNFPSVNFGDTKKNDQSNIRCKVFPGDADWPTAKEWTLLNTTLGGALLRPEPLAAACYPNDPLFNAEQCNLLLATRSRVFIDDALSLGNGWPQGNTCPLTRNPTGNCTRGGYPEYVVNATSARQIQIAVNFARNRNIRLVVK
jgi:hypothetical protein